MSQKGKVSQVIGPVVDVEFGSDNELPRIYDSLEVVKYIRKIIQRNG